MKSVPRNLKSGLRPRVHGSAGVPEFPEILICSRVLHLTIQSEYVECRLTPLRCGVRMFPPRYKYISGVSTAQGK